MKILIATPLYPPDIAGHAPYVKELARRLSDSHEITILTYNHIPETIPDVEIITIPKMLPALIRMFRFTRAFLMLQKRVDVVFIQNGPSVEIPLIIASRVTHPPYILRLGDETPLVRATLKTLFGTILRTAIARAQMVMTHGSVAARAFTKDLDEELLAECAQPPHRPEILPFRPFPEKEMETWNSAWREHVHYFLNILTAVLI